MKAEAIAHVKEITANWAYMKNLPPVIHDFQLQILNTEYDDIYDLYKYVDDRLHCSATAYYHAETDEYKLRVKIGSFEFCHKECIASSLEEFENILCTRFDEILHHIIDFNVDKIGNMFKNKHIIDWDFSSMLPDHLENFELFIRPSKPLRITNGSYVILDYENFSCNSNFVIYYNIFRDEFFSDARVAGVPDINYEFDSQTLEELQDKLAVHLNERLKIIRERAEKELLS